MYASPSAPEPGLPAALVQSAQNCTGDLRVGTGAFVGAWTSSSGGRDWGSRHHDQETDLFENWNRYYDPSTGRYLQPEPLMASPRYVAAMAASGVQIGGYSYAANNPIGFVDPDGRKLHIPTATRIWAWLFGWEEPLWRLEQAIVELEKPGCACALRKGFGYDKAPWDERDIGLLFDPTLNAIGANGVAAPWDSVIYLNPKSENFAHTIAHEAGHFRFPYFGHGSRPKRFGAERVCGVSEHPDYIRDQGCECP